MLVMMNVEVRETLESDLNTLNQYIESFDSIKEVAELDDVDAIIARFLQQEAENFALFNYVTELNGEIESRQEEVNDVQQNINTMKDEQQRTNAASEQQLELLMVRSTTLRHIRNVIIIDQRRIDPLLEENQLQRK